MRTGLGLRDVGRHAHQRIRLLALMLRARLRAWRCGAGGPVLTDLAVRTPIRTFYPGRLFDPLGIRVALTPRDRIPACGLSPHGVPCDARALSGRRVELELDPSASFFGDCLRVVDAPGEAPALPGLPAFGWSAPPLLGGLAHTKSDLRGRLRLDFEEPDGGFLPFVCQWEEPLRGEDGELLAPNGFRLPVKENVVFAGDRTSQGLLELSTGRLYDFYLSARFSNSAIAELERCNPGLEAPALDFPGLPYAGHAIGSLAVDAETSSVELRLAAQLFLPLGEGTAEAPLVMPPASASASASGSAGEALTARNSSLHPFIQLRAGSRGVRRRARRRTGDLRAFFESHQGRVRSLLVAPCESYFGDVFKVRAKHLDGEARGQSPVFGELRVQFGGIDRGRLPFVLELAPPGPPWLGRFRQALGLLPPGTRPGLLGLRGHLDYGVHRYEQSGLCLMSDGQKLSIGVLDVDSGEIVEPFILRNYLYLSMFEEIVLAEPRTPTDSFAYSCGGAFSSTEGRLRLELEGATHIPYPEGYRFPLGRGVTTVEQGSCLEPFLRLTASEPASAGAPPAGIYRPRQLTRGLGRAAQMTACRMGPEDRLTLIYAWGRVEARIRRRRLLIAPDRLSYLYDAETRRQPLLLALELGPSCRLVVASGRQDLDCESAGSFDQRPRPCR